MSEDLVVREMTLDELPRAWELGRLAFGSAAASPPASALELSPGVTRYGAFDGKGRLIGKANDLHHEQWWGGSRLSAADVGGVAVAPEARGAGVSRALLRRVLESGRDRGAAVSALFPTVSAVYRSAGWATVGAMRTVDVPSALLPRDRSRGRLAVRAGTPADAEAAHQLYTRVARSRNGMLSRNGPLFRRAGDRFADGVDGLTVVEEEETLVGFASWTRGVGYGPEAVISVGDMIASTAEAARELIGVLASWRSVTPTVRFRTLLSGAVMTEVPVESARQHRADYWMHRPVDVVRAVNDRTWPMSSSGATTFSLYDELAPWNTGTWALEISEGKGRLERTAGPSTLRLQPQGFASLYCGIATPAMLGEVGLADAGPGDDLTSLTLLMAGPPPELLDYF